MLWALIDYVLLMTNTNKMINIFTVILLFTSIDFISNLKKNKNKEEITKHLFGQTFTVSFNLSEHEMVIKDLFEEHLTKLSRTSVKLCFIVSITFF